MVERTQWPKMTSQRWSIQQMCMYVCVCVCMFVFDDDAMCRVYSKWCHQNGQRDSHFRQARTDVDTSKVVFGPRQTKIESWPVRACFNATMRWNGCHCKSKPTGRKREKKKNRFCGPTPLRRMIASKRVVKPTGALATAPCLLPLTMIDPCQAESASNVRTVGRTRSVPRARVGVRGRGERWINDSNGTTRESMCEYECEC